jgi:heme exporter protein CcmD
MQTYTSYIMSAYGIVLGCLIILAWMSLRRAIRIKKQLRHQAMDTPA